ncbi:MAG: radical SAM protein [Clostridia bacterium]|nr:radical SAM protein [Clostridia bacterium]
MMRCYLCPRKCGADRENTLGACKCGENIRVAKVMVHMWEEPCISGENGSGAIFFGGCPLGCVYCQNKEISRGYVGEEITPQELGDIMLDLQNQGVHNINLVTPTHFSDKIREAISLVKSELKIPIVYNTSGYELDTEIEKMAGYVDVFLCDIKYFSSEISKKYSSAPDYYEVAKRAFDKMLRLVQECTFDKNGIMTKGVILRHLVLPTLRHDSMKILEDIKNSFDISSFKLSLMSQYTPDFCPDDYKEIKRRVTTFEYNSVVDYAISLGYDGYIQDKSSSNTVFTPKF